MDNAALLAGITSNTVMLMGLCFLLGSLSTIFLLLLLDMVRSSRLAHAHMLQEEREQLESMQKESRNAT